MTIEKSRLAVVGPLADMDLIFAEHLARVGHDITILRPAKALAGMGVGTAGYSRFGKADIVPFGSPWDLARKARRFDFVFTFTASYAFGLSYLLPLYRVMRRLGWPEYMNICTGSDVMERSVERSIDGTLQRLAFSQAYITVLVNYPVALRNAAALRLRNAVVLPFPYLSAPEPAGSAPRNLRSSPDEMLILHPSHLDWGETDSNNQRASIKGNDRFLRALARFAQTATFPVRALILDRGPDRQRARELVAELNLTRNVTWLDQMTRDELYSAIKQSDLVVDQFEVGGLGGIAWEAMSLGKPVLMHLATPNDLLAYDEEVPILQAKSEGEILSALQIAGDPNWRAVQNRRIIDWVRQREPVRMMPRYLLYASMATGKDMCGLWTPAASPPP
jgi:glycosyltransferase involved in cell wall biosynthesis